MFSTLLFFAELYPHLLRAIVMTTLAAGTMHTNNMGKNFSVTL
jgi:hypothetical protein